MTITVLISDAVYEMLGLDDPPRCAGRNITYNGATGRHRNIIAGSRDALEALAAELDAVARGVLCNDTDNPSRTREAARRGAASIRKQLREST